MVARSKTRSSRKSRNLGTTFRSYSPQRFPFCTTLKTENSEMQMKTSEFSLRPFDQTQEVFHLRVFGLG